MFLKEGGMILANILHWKYWGKNDYMQNGEQYYDDVKKLYAEKEDADIYEILDFCEKYDEKLNPEHIPSLLRLIYGNIAVPEQNESIANMLDTIVKMYGQVAVNTIVENTYILIEEKSEARLYLILAMIVFWNAKMKLDIVTPLMAANSLWIRCNSERMSIRSRASRLDSGSSSSSSLGLEATARAIATRCCWPPDSSLG